MAGYLSAAGTEEEPEEFVARRTAGDTPTVQIVHMAAHGPDGAHGPRQRQGVGDGVDGQELDRPGADDALGPGRHDQHRVRHRLRRRHRPAAQRGLPARLGPLRQRLLRRLARRGSGDGAVAAPRAREVVRGAARDGVLQGGPDGLAYRRLGRHVGVRVHRGAPAEQGRLHRLRGDRLHLLGRVRPHLLRARAAGPVLGHRHRLLVGHRRGARRPPRRAKHRVQDGPGASAST